MRRYSVKNHWSNYKKIIKNTKSDDIITILDKGRFPNNNTFPPLYKLKPEFKYSEEKIEYLCPRNNKTARKYVIPNIKEYKKFVKILAECWDNSDQDAKFNDPSSIKELIISNKKILPISSSFLRNNLSGAFLDEIYRDSIYKWKEFVQRYLYEDSVHFQYLISLDIKDFYQKIYVHSITWALSGDKKRCKELLKNRRTYKKLLCSKLENSIMNLQDRQTNGIPIGPLGSDLVAEIIMCRIVKNIEKNTQKLDFIGVRFKDDLKILCKNRENAEEILEYFIMELSEYDLFLNDEKTSITQDFSSLVMQSWKKKLLMYPKLSINENKKLTKTDLMLLDDELMSLMVNICETIKPNEGNFWYEFERRYLVDIKLLTKKYPIAKQRIIVWLLKQLNEYSQHTGVILKIVMSLVSQRDSKYLKLIRETGRNISKKRNYDFIMMWIIYFVAENYLSKKYSKKLDIILKEFKEEIKDIKNQDIKIEAEKLIEYIGINRNKFVKRNAISHTFTLKKKYVYAEY